MGNRKGKKRKKREQEEGNRNSGDSTSSSDQLSSTTMSSCSTPLPTQHLASPTNYQAAMSQLSQQMFTAPPAPTLPGPMFFDAQQQQTLLQSMNVISQKMNIIMSKMEKLDSIESSVRKIQTKVTGMETEIAAIKLNVSELEKSTTMAHGLLDDVQKRNAKADSEIKSLRSDMSQLHNTQRDIKDSVLDLQFRSMRDNLLFFGIEEQESENPTELILDFCESKLGITGAKTSIKLDRAHRLGRRLGQGRRPRPIVGPSSITTKTGSEFGKVVTS